MPVEWCISSSFPRSALHSSCLQFRDRLLRIQRWSRLLPAFGTCPGSHAMNNRKVVAFLLAACGLLAAASVAIAADPRPSHRPIPPSEPPDDGRLAERLRPTQDLAQLRNLAEKTLQDPKPFNNLTDRKKDLLRKLR